MGWGGMAWKSTVIVVVAGNVIETVNGERNGAVNGSQKLCCA